MQDRSLTVPAELEGRRVDEVVAALMGISVKAAKRLCEGGHVRRVRHSVRKGDRLRAGDELVVQEPPPHPAPIPVLPVVAESGAYLVVDKPAGLPSHRLRVDDPPTAFEAVVAQFPSVATAGPDPREGGLLHRLDVGTSGALGFARDAASFEVGREAFRQGTAHKRYLALVHGQIDDEGELTADIAHDTSDMRRSVVVVDDVRHRGKPRRARTSWRTLHRAGDTALLLIEADGGRRHQVRVHMAFAGAPLWGDDLYGGPRWDDRARLPSHALHASHLSIPHPQHPIHAVVPAPADFVDVVRTHLGLEGVSALTAALTH